MAIRFQLSPFMPAGYISADLIYSVSVSKVEIRELK